MDISHAYGTPMLAAVIVALAVLLLGGLHFAFSGNVMF